MSEASEAIKGEQRPVPRRVLPFRQIRTVSPTGWPGVELEYFGDEVLPLAGTKQRMPFRHNEAHNRHLHAAILELMQMFWDVEATVDGLIRQRDEAVANSAMVEGELRREVKRANELEARLRKKRESQAPQ